LQAGQRVAVALAPEGLFSWDVPAAEGASVRRGERGRRLPGQQPARAAFLAIRSCSATLTAIDDTACLHAQPACAPAQQEWRVTITVTGGFTRRQRHAAASASGRCLHVGIQTEHALPPDRACGLAGDLAVWAAARRSIFVPGKPLGGVGPAARFRAWR